MKYFHMSLDYGHLIKEFVPRIPLNSAPSENTTIGRICVSNFLEGCMLAHPDYREVFFLLYRENQDCKDYYHPDHYSCDLNFNGKEYSGHLVRVYEFYSNKNDSMFTNEQIVEKKLVPDAKDTGEAWFLNARKPDMWYNLLLLNATKIIEVGKIIGKAEYINLGHFMPYAMAAKNDLTNDVKFNVEYLDVPLLSA